MPSSRVSTHLADALETLIEGLSDAAILECLSSDQKAAVIQDADIDDILKHHEEELRKYFEDKV